VFVLVGVPHSPYEQYFIVAICMCWIGHVIWLM